MQHWSNESVERLLVGRRAHRRSRLRIQVFVKGSAGSWERATLLEISVSGFRLEALPAGVGGHSLWLRIGDFDPLPARVLWTAVEGVGCRFLFPIEQSTFEQIIRYSHGIDSQPSAEGR